MVNRDRYLSLYNLHINKNNKHDQQIKLDIVRTYTDFDFFKEKKNIKKLFNVLHVLACVNPDFGYTQGINFIVGYFLIRYQGNEIKTFKLVNIFLKNDKYGLTGIYIDKFPKLFLTKYQINKLLEEYLPKLNEHLKKNNIETLTWLSSWILTLFVKNLEKLNFKHINKFFDLFITYGWIIVIKFCIIILEQVSQKILKKESSELLVYLIENIWNDLNLKNLTELINKNKITLNELLDLELEYIEMLSKPKKKIKKRRKITKIKKNIIIGGSNAVLAGISSLILGIVLSKN